MATGKFIVIDGTDGSGKTTQTELLIKRLEQSGEKVRSISFPQYGQKSAGPVEEYLNGKYGEAKEVGPYRASVFYATDRYDGSFQMKQWLDEGTLLISNRYVSASMGHQGGKISDPEKRKKFLDWLYDLEYNIFEIPQPTLNIILHVTPEISQQLVDKKGHRDYVGGTKRDIHEDDIDHLRDAEQAYLDIAKMPGFTLIECTRDGKMMTREDIHELIWQKVQEVLQN